MSRVGRKPILIPERVEVKIEGNSIAVKGPLGELSENIPPEIKVEIKNGQILVSPSLETKQTKALWGTTRARIANLIKGVLNGYEKQLQIEGIGYKASMEGNSLLVSVGFTHPVKIAAIAGIKFSVGKNIITVFGSSKESVMQTAATIRKIKPPEPYKGKGIRYVGEIVRHKVGKRAVATVGAGK